MIGLFVSSGIVIAVAIWALLQATRSARHPPELTPRQQKRIAGYLAGQRRARLRVVKGGKRHG